MKKGTYRHGPDWIICSQTKNDLARYLGPVVWVNKCLRCGQEKPSYAGRLNLAIKQAEGFIKIHSECKESE